MNLRERLDADMKDALRARDRIRLETVRGIRGAVHNKEIELGEALDDDGIVRVLRTLAKQRQEAIEQYRGAGRTELAETEQAELGVIEGYLPAAPDPAAIEAAVREAIAETGASGPRDMGRVMKAALERLGSAADGRSVNAAARKLLQPPSDP